MRRPHLPTTTEGLPASFERRFGKASSVEMLGGGQSGAAVKRVTIGPTSMVLKSAKPAEAHFYERVASAVSAAGVGVPECLRSFVQDGVRWLVLEDIPLALPRERWLADLSVLGALRRLHEADLDLPSLPGMYRPAWPGEMSAAAVDALPADRRDRLEPIIERYREESAPLFEPRHAISGDPNPTNWGIRRDGTVVLFDWERFSAGTAALDLAISIPWLPDEAAYQVVAGAYLGPGHGATAVSALAGRIAVAKVWNVVEYLSLTVTGDLPPSERVGVVIAAASDWLERAGRPLW